MVRSKGKLRKKDRTQRIILGFSKYRIHIEWVERVVPLRKHVWKFNKIEIIKKEIIKENVKEKTIKENETKE